MGLGHVRGRCGIGAYTRLWRMGLEHIYKGLKEVKLANCKADDRRCLSEARLTEARFTEASSGT